MKAKTIKKILKAKVDEWSKSIQDKKVAKMVKTGTIITGGSIASMLLKEKVNDFDVYFKDIETAEAVACYYINQYNGFDRDVVDGSKAERIFKGMTDEEAHAPFVVRDSDRIKIMIKSSGQATTEEGKAEAEKEEAVSFNIAVDGSDNEDAEEVQEGAVEEVEEDNSYNTLFISQNAITLTDKIQIVLRFFGSPEEIHENYDFTHCTCWWSSWDNHLELRADAMECLLTRELVYQGSKYPLCSIIRTRKFIKRGWQINAGQYLKMCMQLNELDLTDVAVLEDQLTGVDVAYFHMVISIIKNAKKDISSSYVCEIIDKIF